MKGFIQNIKTKYDLMLNFKWYLQIVYSEHKVMKKRFISYVSAMYYCLFNTQNWYIRAKVVVFISVGNNPHKNYEISFRRIRTTATGIK